MRRKLMVLVSSFLSGLCIAFGATVYLMCMSYGSEYRFLGAFLFGIGLFTIIHFGFWLYTGKVGKLLDNKPKYILDLIVCLAGNFLGVATVAGLMLLTRQADTLRTIATPIVEAKQDDAPYSLFINAIFCGVMIYLAVVGHDFCPYPLGKVLFAFLPIMLFIIVGFEHCVANLAYYMYAGSYSWQGVLNFIIMILGNAVGSVSFDGLIKLVIKLGINQKKAKTEDIKKNDEDLIQ
ncbi:MAG: formate/nitrite transporter family protein [Acholeplasmatales bacterium]|nr:formate/nitrite transporter family protein [Acholeplasmatales bacterium]